MRYSVAMQWVIPDPKSLMSILEKMRTGPFIPWVMVLFVLSGVLVAQEAEPVGEDVASTAEMGVLRMRFLDSTTGAAIQPNRIIIDHSPQQYTPEPPGVVRVELPNGQHDIEIQAEDYLPLQAKVQVDGQETLVHDFELDPAQPTEETPLEPTEAIIHGNVTDALTGLPLEDARVTSADGGTTRTDTGGYFEVRLSVPPHRDDEIAQTNLEIARDGYITEKMQQLQVVGGSRRRQQVRMEPVTSETLPSEMVRETIEELPSPAQGYLYEWVFDVTF